jgi:outer membrane protein, heavy metal efflux system
MIEHRLNKSITPSMTDLKVCYMVNLSAARLNSQRLRCFIATLMPLLLLGYGLRGFAQTQTPLFSQTEPPSLAQVLQFATQNLDSQIADTAVLAGQAHLVSADHAPLPVISGKLSQLDLQNGIGSGNLATGKRIDRSVGLDWTYERAGKRQLRTTVAQHSLLAAQFDAQEVRVNQMMQAAAAYFDWLVAREKAQLYERLAEAATEANKVAQLRLKAGDLSQQDATRVAIDVARLTADQHSVALELAKSVLA